ncbi:PKD-like family lipoprotein [Sphingobacterium paucimobilis]|uniref:PKD domain-containing protein n=1 Tax=Sphingobacterium paucimobilis HER1398 TaxID=1346330 RepID=U2IZ01_9SPHI|nr:PKD-like family lipoprotein [Sphingobacterium paucimobilis]ERJ57929.1 hypothetical protein M472_04035 [Sphingobacterium paucimobilis HER1398]
MKRYYSMGLVVGLVLLLSSCFKDLGNYNYQDINEITVGGLGGPYNLLYKVDTLRIEPDIQFTLDTDDPDRYQYEWRVGFQNEGATRPTISTERNLNFPVNLLPKAYTLYFNVYDKVTEVTWTSTASLTVSTAVSRGFHLAGDDEEGYADADMIAMPLNKDTIIVKRIMSDNGMPRYKEPIKLFHTGTTSDSSKVKQWFMTKEGAYFMNTATMEVKPGNTFKNMLYTTFELPLDIYPVAFAPLVSSIGGMSPGTYGRVVITNTGDLFSASLMGGDFYSNPINRVSSNPLELLKLSPYIMHSPATWNRYIVYDDINNRFLHATGNSVPSAMLTVFWDTGGPFPWNQGDTGRKLVYAENTRNYEDGGTAGNSFALMKDAAGEFHVYKFYANGSFGPLKLAYFKIKPIAVDFEKSNIYAFSSVRKILYYAVGSKLYGYDYNPSFEKNYLIKDFGEEITMLNSDIQTSNGSQLYVGTYSTANKGTIRKYSSGDDLNNLVMTQDESVFWTGLLKVKSMSWRNSTQ